MIELQLWSGQHAEAQRTLADLLKTVPPDRRKPGRLAPEQAAILLGSCMTAARSDAKLAEPERVKTATAYGDDAMKWLGVAVEQGFKDAGVLESQKELEPLRVRTDFQDLVRNLRSNKK